MNTKGNFITIRTIPYTGDTNLHLDSSRITALSTMHLLDEIMEANVEARDAM